MVAKSPLMINTPVLKNPVDKYRYPGVQNINMTCLIAFIFVTWFMTYSLCISPLMINKPVLKNPVDKYRNPGAQNINMICLIVFIFVTWFITCSAYLIQPIQFLIKFQASDSGIKVKFNEYEMPLLSLNFHGNEIAVKTWILLSGPIIFLLLLESLNIFPKFWTVIAQLSATHFFMVLPLYNVVNAIYKAFYYTPDEYKPWLDYDFVTELFQVAISLLVLYGTVTNFSRLTEVMKKTGRVIFFFPALFLFGLITLWLSTIAIAFGFFGYMYFDDTVYGYLSLFGGIYVCLLIFHFVTALASHCAFTWWCTENKKELSRFIILKCIRQTFRNHGRLILFNCTVILPIVRWMFCSPSRSFNPAFPQIRFKAYIVREWLISYGLEYALPIIATREAPKDKIFSIFTRNIFSCHSFAAIFGTLLALFGAIEKVIVFCGANFISVWSKPTHVDFLNQSVINWAMLMYSFGFLFMSLVIGASILIFTATEDIRESVEQVVMAVKEGEGIELCIINHNPETTEKLIV